MIAERIDRKSSGTSFKRLASYILNEKDGGSGDPVDWQLAEYVLDSKHAGEKVASHRITNCESTDAGWAVKECLALAAMNKRSTKDRAYHLVVSFPEGERPTDEQMIDIEDKLVAAIGFADHKRISAVHQNTDNWHLHIAIVTVHPQSLRNVTPYYDQYRLQEACQALEIKHELMRDNHSRTPERPLNGKASELEAHAGRVSFARWVAENAAAPLIEAAGKARTWNDLHTAAAGLGVVIQQRGAGLIVASRDGGKGRMKASAVGPGLAFKPLTDRLGPYEAPSPAVAQQEATLRYVGAPVGVAPDLWTRYQQERQAVTDVRTADMATLRATHLRYATELQAWHAQRFTTAKAQHLSYANKVSTYQKLKSDAAADHARRRAMEIANRQKVKDKHPPLTWVGFLAREAGRGDDKARASLQRAVTRRLDDDQARAEAERGEGR